MLAGLLASAAAFGCLPAWAQPSGGTVVMGAAGISTAGNTTTITQSSARAIINWQDFSVGAGQSVQFSQPGASSITLNRVTGGAPSVIDGAMSANGQVWLLNRNGILVGQGANIDVGGLLASTSAITDKDFADGRYRFSGGGNAVANHGAIRARKGGSVVLSAPSVANTGLIEAEAGHVVLGGTDAFTVDFAGDHLLSYALDGAQAGSVTNSGVLRAAGGRVTMTARAAAGIAAGVLNNSGVVEAVSVRSENGEIVLDAGDGSASNSGTLNASGRGDGETGGSVTLLGRTIEIADGAALDVSGDAGAGRIDIGGKGAAAAAQETRIGKARMTADAIRSGNGGAVTIWSEGHTDFAGSISARGGARGGNGGQVETSGYTLRVDPASIVDTLAPLGSAGTWLLDPHGLVIQAGGGTLNLPFGSPPSVFTMDPSAITTALATGNMTLQSDNDIVINTGFTVPGSTTNTLTLQAGRTISLANGQIVSYPTGNIVLSANDPGAVQAFRNAGPAFIQTGSAGGFLARRLDLILASDGLDGSSIGTSATPFFDRGSATYVKTNGASAFSTSFNLGNTGHALGVDMGAGSLTLTATSVQQTAPLSLGNLTILLPAGASSTGQVSLNNVANAITGTVNATVMSSNTAGGFAIVNGQSLTAGTINVVPTPAGGVTRGVATLRTVTGDITLTGNITASLVSLIADNGNINQTGGVLSARATAAGATGRINTRSFGNTNLPSAGNSVEGLVFATGNGAETTLNPGVLTIFSGGSTTINAASSVMLTGSSSSSSITTAGGGLAVTVTGTTALTNAAGAPVNVFNGIGINTPISVPTSIAAGLAPTSPAIPATTGGTIALHAAGDVRQLIGPLAQITNAGGLTVVSDHGSIDLRASFTGVDGSGNPFEISNAVQGVVSLAANEGSAVLLQPAQIRLGTSSAAGLLSVLQCVSAATCALHPPQNLIIEPGATLTSLLAAGDGVILGTQRNFINNSGSTAIRVPNGARWLVYSGAPAGDVFNGLDSGNTAIWGIQNLGIAAPGNRYAFLLQPTVTVTGDTVSKPIGLDYSDTLGGRYSVTGLQAGVAGAFLGDTAALFSGAPALSSAGAAADAATGNYTLVVAPGSFAVANGYALAFQNGTLTVIPSAVAIIEPLTSFTVTATAPVTTTTATATAAPSIVATVVEAPVVVTVPVVTVAAPVTVAAQPVLAPAAPLATLASSTDGTTAETPVASDSATNDIATLEPAGTAAAAASTSSSSSSTSAASIIIPGMLTAAPTLPPQPPPQAGTLSGWGNTALWQ